MSRFFLMVLENYGLGILNLSLLGYVSWKLVNNHLRHIADTIKENGKKLEEIADDIVLLKERTSKLEGKIE